MYVSEIESAREMLQRRWDSLQEVWMAVADTWQDSVRVGFEKEYWLDLEDVVPSALAAMQELDEAIERGHWEGFWKA